jgi:GTPase
LFTNVATSLHFSYMRYLENRLRERFGFLGTPLKLTIRKRAREESGARKGPK